MTGRRSAELQAIRVRDTQPLCYQLQCLFFSEHKALAPIFWQLQNINQSTYVKRKGKQQYDLYSVLYATISSYFKAAGVLPPIFPCHGWYTALPAAVASGDCCSSGRARHLHEGHRCCAHSPASGLTVHQLRPLRKIYLLFFLCSIKIIFWLFQMIVVSYDGAEQNKLGTSSDGGAGCILPGWFNKGQRLKITCKKLIFETWEKGDGSVPGQSCFRGKEESFLSPVTGSLLDHCPISRATITLIFVNCFGSLNLFQNYKVILPLCHIYRKT